MQWFVLDPATQKVINDGYAPLLRIQRTGTPTPAMCPSRYLCTQPFYCAGIAVHAENPLNRGNRDNEQHCLTTRGLCLSRPHVSDGLQELQWLESHNFCY